MSKLTVSNTKHIPSTDIDPTKRYDVRDVDALVVTCIEAAKDALHSRELVGFSDFEQDQLVHVLDGFRHSHQSIRILLKGEQSPSAVAALAIARLQVESLYSLCYLLENPANVRLLLKNGWKKRYIRFLLHRAECRNFSRFDEHYSAPRTALQFDGLQELCFVSDEERKTIEHEEIGTPLDPAMQEVVIPKFPTPRGVIKALTNQAQITMLKRLYFDYQYLCSFAHGDSEASLFRELSNPRSPAHRLINASQIEDFHQRQILEDPILYSSLSAIQAATEVAAIYPANIELLVRITKAWEFLRTSHLLAVSVWDMRSKAILPLIN